MTEQGMMQQLLAQTADPDWIIDETGYDPLRECSRESRFAISNGFLGVRGQHTINRGERCGPPPRTYVAGLFDSSGPEQPTPGLVTAPDWLQIRISVRDEPLLHSPSDGASHRRMLDLKRGAVINECRLSGTCGVTLRLRHLRLTSLDDRAIAQQLIRLEVESGEADITLEASFEGLGAGLITEITEQDLGVWRTVHCGTRLGMAAGLSLRADGELLRPTALGPFKWSWTWRSRRGGVAEFERSVAVTRSPSGFAEPGATTRDKLAAARDVGWPGVVRAHEAAWADRWIRSEVAVEGDAAARQALRFALYHLNGAANPGDEHVSIGARALTGDDYRGHVFWDTEIFLLPFYVMTWPEAARALLMYRFHTLDGARGKAARMGWRGALYAWESADTGAETTPDYVIGPDRKVIEVLCGSQEQHISADVAYAVWQYWQATGDEEFLLHAGAEILLETGRFWSSRATPEADGRRHIRGVIGPDEYHEHIDDNAFTNVMARWNIRRALEVASLVRERWPDRWASLSARLGLAKAELAEWKVAADTIVTGLDAKSGLFEQFEGYFGLEEIDLALYSERSVPLDVVLGRERAGRSKVIKQADVVALLALLPEEFAANTGATNFRYYESRCGNGSSLSRAMHGVAAARLGLSEDALAYFRQTAAIDLSDSHVAIDGGVHIAALGGVWLMAVFGFAGLSFQGESLGFDPKLPGEWKSLGFPVQWRGRHLRVLIEQPAGLLKATLEAGDPMHIVIGGESYPLRCDAPLSISFRPLPNSRAA